MGNKESRDNNRESDCHSNNQPREMISRDRLARENAEINRIEKETGERVTVRDYANRPEIREQINQAREARERAYQERLDRELNRTENPPKERVSVREHAREDRESKHDLTNTITSTSEAKQPVEEKKRKAATTPERKNSKSRKITPVANEQPKETATDSRSDEKLGDISSSSKAPSQLVANASDKKQEEHSDKNTAQEPVGTEKTSQSSSKSGERLTVESLHKIVSDPDTRVSYPREACKANAQLFKKGNDWAMRTTAGACTDATLLGLKSDNVARKILNTTGCAAGTLSTSVCGFIADKWDEHCDTLPDAIITPPPDSDIEKIIVTFPSRYNFDLNGLIDRTLFGAEE